jgi:hypothetical protein
MLEKSSEFEEGDDNNDKDKFIVNAPQQQSSGK